MTHGVAIPDGGPDFFASSAEGVAPGNIGPDKRASTLDSETGSCPETWKDIRAGRSLMDVLSRSLGTVALVASLLAAAPAALTQTASQSP